MVGQFDCGSFEGWKTRGPSLYKMDPIEKCFATLKVLISQPEQAGLQLAERAIDE